MKAASAEATVPPFAVTKAGLYVEASERSKEFAYVPLVALGNAGNGTATGSITPTGPQQ